PSRHFLLPCRLYPRCLSKRATVFFLTSCPRCCKARTRLRRLRAVHSKLHSGSPRVVDSTNSLRSVSSVGSLSVAFFRPPPARRLRVVANGSSRPHWMARLSWIPLRIVALDIPVARVTAATPPKPNARASLAANSRRLRSVKLSLRRANRSWIATSAAFRWLMFFAMSLYVYLRSTQVNYFIFGQTLNLSSRYKST